MFSEDEPVSTRTEYNRDFLLGMILLLVIIMLTCCLLMYLLYNQLNQPRSIPQPEMPALALPTAVAPSVFPLHFPVILSGPEPVPVTEKNWKVTNISYQGYELGGQRYDLVTFTRIDGQETAQGYCIDPGLDVPDIGIEYMLNAEGIFVPLVQPVDHPLQRFEKLR
ncbi:MAG: hypothetical protein JXB15_10085 [Anaerolineales bacterium]|nr:hypothetical protein [Anaerolineales bacterium]